MQETKLTVRLPRHLVEKAKHYAARNQTTLTNLIEAYLHNIPAEGELERADIVQRLTGILSPQASIEDYRRQLEEKYGR